MSFISESIQSQATLVKGAILCIVEIAYFVCEQIVIVNSVDEVKMYLES